MSNHFHMLLRELHDNLHEFMCYFQGNLARALNKLRKRRGSFRERRYTHAPVLDESSQVEGLVCLMTNPVKADLVGSRWFNRTAWHAADAPAERHFFIEKHVLSHRVLPAWNHVSKRKQRRLLEKLFADQAAHLRMERRREGRTLVPRGELIGCPPTGIPKQTPLTPHPPCDASTEESRKSFRLLWTVFVSSYREASRLVAAGMRGIRKAVFPPGSLPPCLPRPWPVPP
ncbi:MAG: hypothetical protein ACE5F1_05275 [Planctomycetota bacterium]